jgi:hypothetical protein
MPNRRPPLDVTKVMLLLGRAQGRSWILVGDQVMMPADLERLHKELREFERIDAVSDEMRAVSEELRPELVPGLPPKGGPRVWPLRALQNAPGYRSATFASRSQWAANCSQVFLCSWWVVAWANFRHVSAFSLARLIGTCAALLRERSVYVP